MKRPGELDRWVMRVLDEVDASDVERALRDDDLDRYDRFCADVVTHALAAGFRQERQAIRLLVAQFLHGATVRADDTPDDEIDEEGVRITTLTEGYAPTETLVMACADQLQRRETWSALAEERPTFPTRWLGNRVFWRARDSLRGKRGEAPEVPSPFGKRHRVAAWLEDLAEADLDLGGPEAHADARGVYTAALGKIARHLAEECDGIEAFHYVLRKLFPWHAWPSVPPLDMVGAPLDAGLGARWHLADRAAVATLVQCAAFDTVSEGLDASAAFHRARRDFPGWPEVCAWTGTQSEPVNTLQRRVGRINAELEQFVASRRERVAALYAREE